MGNCCARERGEEHAGRDDGSREVLIGVEQVPGVVVRGETPMRTQTPALAPVVVVEEGVEVACVACTRTTKEVSVYATCADDRCKFSPWCGECARTRAAQNTDVHNACHGCTKPRLRAPEPRDDWRANLRYNRDGLTFRHLYAGAWRARVALSHPGGVDVPDLASAHAAALASDRFDVILEHSTDALRTRGAVLDIPDEYEWGHLLTYGDTSFMHALVVGRVLRDLAGVP